MHILLSTQVMPICLWSKYQLRNLFRCAHLSCDSLPTWNLVWGNKWNRIKCICNKSSWATARYCNMNKNYNNAKSFAISCQNYSPVKISKFSIVLFRTFFAQRSWMSECVTNVFLFVLVTKFLHGLFFVNTEDDAICDQMMRH